MSRQTAGPVEIYKFDPLFIILFNNFQSVCLEVKQ